MAICDIPGCTAHYGCILRRKGLMLSSSASPTMRNNVRPRKTPDPSWEAGIAVDRRPGGTVMPLMDAGATRYIRTKEAGERRHEIDSALRRAKGPVN